MTKKELYTCDICHTDYHDKADALKCEKEHLKCIKIADTRYKAHSKMPHKIVVEFSNGTRHWYIL